MNKTQSLIQTCLSSISTAKYYTDTENKQSVRDLHQKLINDSKQLAKFGDIIESIYNYYSQNDKKIMEFVDTLIKYPDLASILIQEFTYNEELIGIEDKETNGGFTFHLFFSDDSFKIMKSGVKVEELISLYKCDLELFSPNFNPSFFDALVQNKMLQTKQIDFTTIFKALQLAPNPSFQYFVSQNSIDALNNKIFTKEQMLEAFKSDSWNYNLFVSDNALKILNTGKVNGEQMLEAFKFDTKNFHNFISPKSQEIMQKSSIELGERFLQAYEAYPENYPIIDDINAFPDFWGWNTN